MTFTKEEDWALDPFTRVGSSLIAAAIYKRAAVGIDRDPEYCQIAQKRLEEAIAGNPKLRPMGNQFMYQQDENKLSRDQPHGQKMIVL